MRYARALVIAVLSAAFWLMTGLAYYASVAGDQYPEPRQPTFLETYGKGVLVLVVATLIFSFLVYLLDRRRPR